MYLQSTNDQFELINGIPLDNPVDIKSTSKFGVIESCTKNCANNKKCGGFITYPVGIYDAYYCWEIPPPQPFENYKNKIYWPRTKFKTYMKKQFAPTNNQSNLTKWYNNLTQFDAYNDVKMSGQPQTGQTTNLPAAQCAKNCLNDQKCDGFVTGFAAPSSGWPKPQCTYIDTNNRQNNIIVPSPHSAVMMKRGIRPTTIADLINDQYAPAPQNKCPESYKCFYNHNPKNPSKAIKPNMFPGAIFSVRNISPVTPSDNPINVAKTIEHYYH